jgi:branched-subunit amino acid ABC-type transport system permease component
MILDSISGGLISAVYLVPIVIAFCIASVHGKYLPLWLPSCGLTAAYFCYWGTEVLQISPLVVLPAAVCFSAGLAVVLHWTLFRGHVDRGEPYPALLKAIAIIVFLESFLSWTTHGYALSFREMKPAWTTELPRLGLTVDFSDMAALGAAAFLAPLVPWVLRSTWPGLAYRAVASNRNLAPEYQLPVARIDVGSMALCGAMSAAGAVVFAMKYDLNAQMLGDPTMKIAAVVVAFGAERPTLAIGGILIIGVIESIAQSVGYLATFSSSVAYVVLVGALLFRHAAGVMRSRATA